VGYVLVDLLFRYWIRCYRIVGPENVPSSGGLFLIANHTSGLDPFLVGGFLKHRMITGPGKAELFSNPIFAYVLRRIGLFPLHRGAADPAAVRHIVEIYRGGGVVLIYPEGARSTDGQLLPFVPELARLIIKLKAPLVPVAIAGANDALPIHGRIPRLHTPVAVVYGTPFELDRYYGQKLTPEVMHEAAQVMRDRVAELLEVAREERRKAAESC
jgi:1-acyl-sn-glycerol-3-phosphate acyltransferase